MSTHPAATIVRRLDKLVTAQRYSHLTDRELLLRFAKEQDESAFAALLHKHGPMVLNVCRRALHNDHDAEDVFQATFLVLLKKADALSGRDSVAGWLHEVAYRLAARSKADAMRRGIQERRAAAKGPEDPVRELTVREAQACLHEELHRLPESMRSPLVLCYLQSQTQDEAARQLGWSLRTFKRRLEHGRTMLQRRLTQRGLTLSAVLSTGVLPVSMASAGLIPATLKAAMSLASGKATGAVPASVGVLVEGALRGIFLAKVKFAVALALLASVLGTGIALIDQQLQPVEPQAHRAGPVAQTIAGDSKQESTKPTLDRFGDALPEHAVARMGSLRFQHGQIIEQLQFSKDGGKILVNGRSSNRAFDSATGKEWQLAEGSSSIGACFAGNQILVVGRKAAPGRPSGVWNLETGRLVMPINVRFDGGSVEPGGRIAVLHSQMANATTFRFLDLQSGKLTEPIPAQGVGQVDHYWFSADGKRLVTAGLIFPKGRAFAVWDVQSGRLLRDPGLGDQSIAWVCCLAPDGRSFGNIRDRGDRFDLHDAATFGFSASFNAPPKTRLYSGAISPDGSVVAAFSESTIFLWDRKTGKEIRQIPGRGTMEQVIAFSPDGKRLAVAEGNSVSLYDVATGAPCHTYGHTNAIFSLRFAPDGKRLYSAAGYLDSGIRVWRPLTGEMIERWDRQTQGIYGIALSSDGRQLVSGSQDRTTRILDSQSGKELFRLDVDTRGHFLAFLPDGQWFVAADGKLVRLHDSTTGKIVTTHEFPEKTQGFTMHGQDLWGREDRSNMLLSMDLTSGKVKHRLKVPEGRYWRFALAPDGGRIAVGTEKGTVHLIDARTGDEYRQFKIRQPGEYVKDWPTGFAFSQDGELLAVGTGRGMVSLWELGSGKERTTFQGHRGGVICLAFSPDRKLLVSGGWDTTILAWDLYGVQAGLPRPAPGSLDKLWEDLRHTDPALAYPAIKGFAADAATTTAFFARKHQPAPKVADKVLRTWIEQLDSADFKLRTESYRQLKTAARQAEPLLRAALAKQPSLEFGRRAEQLLAELAESPDHLRWARVAEILRVLDTPAARELLQKMEQ